MCSTIFYCIIAFNRELFAGFLADCTRKGVLMAVSGQKNPETGDVSITDMYILLFVLTGMISIMLLAGSQKKVKNNIDMKL